MTPATSRQTKVDGATVGRGTCADRRVLADGELARDLSVIFVTGPGHGGSGLVANAYLEGTYTNAAAPPTCAHE